jgi:hypothetical protein
MTQQEYVNEILEGAGFCLLRVAPQITYAKRNDGSITGDNQNIDKGTSIEVKFQRGWIRSVDVFQDEEVEDGEE